MKFEKNDISDKMRQAVLFDMAPEAVIENAKVRCLIDNMIRDKREARSAIKLSGKQSTAAGRRSVEALRGWRRTSRKKRAKEGVTPAPSKRSQSL